MKIGFQLWSVHQLLDDDEQAELIIKQIKLAGYQGVELFNIDNMQMFNRITNLLLKYELPIISAHCDYEIIDKNLEEVLNRYSQFQLQSIVVPIAFEITKSERDMNQVIQRLCQLRKICLSHNIELYYHNHDSECLEIGNDYIINHLGRAGILLEYDVHWLVRGGLNPYDVILNKYPSRQLHIKDVKMINDNDEFKLVDCAIGQGTLNVERIVECANSVSVEWLFVEQEYNSPHINEQIIDIRNSFNALESARRIYEN